MGPKAVRAINISIKGYQMPHTVITKSSKIEKKKVVLKKRMPLEQSTDQISLKKNAGCDVQI